MLFRREATPPVVRRCWVWHAVKAGGIRVDVEVQLPIGGGRIPLLALGHEEIIETLRRPHSNLVREIDEHHKGR